MTTPFQVTARLREPVTVEDHVRGPSNAAVTIIEYGDFQCPFCGAAYPNLHELLRQRSDTVRLIYRYFPIANVHPYAERAAETAEAAASRGKFWEMHDWLYEHQDQLDPVHLSLGVEQLGLPPDEVNDEVERGVYADRVRRDFVGGIRSGVNGTPTLYINDVRHEGGFDLPDLLAAVDAAANA
ncbi:MULTISPECIES: DsbA family protein [Micromonospora]|uniref:DsbA family protein n=1 Tax=Micromonospora TaxID=1873 RepID=UPI0006B018FD|nr:MULTISPECIES: thioredoxin domain-containing protein [Micromonospora]KOX10598.1 DSBA oxidoreductase [Micromonospora sp. NRRL B-16802]NJC10793.1 protein-disulfide isomerase [Micromonospora profundi]